MVTSSGKLHCGALIAAAGLSRRMGALKPLLPLGDSTLLRRCAETFCALGCAPVVVVLGRERARVAASLAGLDVERVFNPDYASCQMLDSVRLGLARLEGRCERFFFTPGDVPLFLPETLKALLAEENVPLVPVHDGQRGHPVLLPAALIPAIRAYGGPGGLRGALEGLGGLRETPVDDPGVLLDADTPEDYRRACALLRQREGAP